MYRIPNIVLSYLIFICFAIILVAAVTLEVYNDSRTSDTYAKGNTAEEHI